MDHNCAYCDALIPQGNEFIYGDDILCYECMTEIAPEYDYAEEGG